MTAHVLDGRPVSRALRERAVDELRRFHNSYATTPRLAIMLVGADPSARAYLNAIVKAADGISMPTTIVELESTVSQKTLNRHVLELNDRPEINGVLILQPLPPHLSRIQVADLLDPLKDIDGVTTFNAGRLFHDDRNVLAPSTPAGGMALLKHYQIPIAGRLAVVLGRSPVVGRPMAAMLLAENATVTTCHSRTPTPERFTREADIVISAVGRPGSLRADMIRPGATVIDFGVNFVDGKMVGDADAPAVAEIAGALTPVPGGTGRVTTSVLLRNTIKAATLQYQRNSAGDNLVERVTGERG
ncbi:MAG TPA: bifunctional 5,10-methylenetetrahydrofolate dehydrogenase/5,10-methenyltetrahydrofolate cyclohydrolase [Thermomicrobiales bacterium]|nr:bifunctional 5,10-methylenetetrahydrofolate dehydrogenase/5,10-methenyltetrahydrofolate cyclohydrolase [Thermomicrobiales bacterium]HRA30980.1 bifunctional 5,10-methylenetetrahydrofolate dehydrogenase/5,10-methenyltetrahydrofolate cyclohydrolase [Thermomicrobiales bacterium]